MDKNTEIPIAEANITVRCGRDGTWLQFTAASGRSASLCIENIAVGRGIIDGALRDWSAERQAQAEQIKADNGQFGVGA